ncbi:MAG: thermonuclease family protein [Hyphomicrobiales bacterium]
MKILDFAKAALLLLCISFLVVWLNGEDWQPLGSDFRIVDGDTLRQGELRIRLAGIDAPETEQNCINAGKGVACGVLAKQHLSGLLAGQEITCSNEGTDKHGRRLSVCKVQGVSKTDNATLVTSGLQASINAQMVHDGWALAYGDYKALEILAAIAQRGLWGLQFEEPEQWRRENGLN